MKIAYYLNEFPAISESFILNQIVELIKKGHDISIFSMINPIDEIQHEEIKAYNLVERTHYFKLENLLEMKNLKKWFFFFKFLLKNIYHTGISKRRIKLDIKKACFAAIMDKMDIDIIHAHFGTNGNHSIQLKQVLKRPLITSFYGFDAAIADSTTYLELFNTADKITVLSNDMKNDMLALGCPEENIIIHHLGVDLDKFSYTQRYVNPNEKAIFLCVGRFVEKKGITYAIKAFSRLLIEYKNVELRIIGDGGMKKEIEDLIFRLKLQKNVILLGSYTHTGIIDEMHRSHIFLLPSITAENGDKEGTPTVLMEAQATGMPVLSTYHAGIPEVVINGKTGYLVEEKNIDSLYEKMKYIVEQPKIWNKLGKNGRNHIKENYNISNQVEKLEYIYKDVIK